MILEFGYRTNMGVDNSQLNVAIVAFNRPKTLKNLLNQLPPDNFSSISFFFDYPKSFKSDEQKYKETVLVAKNWALNQATQSQFFLSDIHLGGNRNTLRAMNHLVNEYGQGLLCEDDSDIHPSYITFLNSLGNRVSMLPDNYLYGVTPYLGIDSRDLGFLKSTQLNFQLNCLMGGTLGLYLTKEMLRDFYITLERLGNKEEFTFLTSRLRSFPLGISLKSSFAHSLMGKYQRYVETWKFGIPNSDTGIPSWDGLLLCSILIRGAKVYMPEYSIVRENPFALAEGSWHQREFTTLSNWKNVPKSLDVGIVDNSNRRKELLKLQISNFQKNGSTPPQLVQGFLLIYLPKNISRLIYKILRKCAKEWHG